MYFRGKKETKDGKAVPVIKNRAVLEAYLAKMKDDTLLDIDIKRHRSKHTDQQRKYWFVIMGIMAPHFGITKDEMHYAIKDKFIGYDKDGLRIVPSIKSLNVKAMGELIDNALIFGRVDYGFILPDPSDYGI